MKRKDTTLFAIMGNLHRYPGSMLQLHTELDAQQWARVVQDTVLYWAFARALKEVGCPQLEEEWDRKSELDLRDLNRSLARMRNIDALLVARFTPEERLQQYKEKMRLGAAQVRAVIAEIAQAQQSGPTINVSEL